MMHTHKSHKNRRMFVRHSRGFTLVEVLATLLLMAIVLPTVMGGLSLAVQASTSARHRSEAAGLAEGKLNELVTTGEWQTGNLSGAFDGDFSNYHWDATVLRVGSGYEWGKHSADRSESELAEPESDGQPDALNAHVREDIIVKRRSPQIKPTGFTLIELLVAMAMVAVLAASLYTSLQVAFKARRTAEASIVESRTVDISMEFLRSALQNALPPNGVLAGNFVGDQGTDGRGDSATDLTFYSSVESPQHVDGNGEIKLVELTIDTPDANGGSSGKDYCLVQKITRNLLAPTVMTPDEEVIARGVREFSCRYFDGQNWQDSWDSSQENNICPRPSK